MSSDSRKSGERLLSRIIRSGFWASSGHVSAQIIRLAGNLVLTRLLVPEMFGVMALAQVFIIMLALISDIGLGPSIIHSKRGDEQLYLNTVWTIQVIRGVVTALCVVLIGVGIYWCNVLNLVPEHSAFAQPELPLVIISLSITLLISGFSSTNLMLANRNLMLGRVTVMDFIVQLVGFVLLIYWAFLYRSIWALVAGTIVTSVLRTILSHYIFPQGLKNSFAWDRPAVKEIVNFGKWIFISSFFTAFYMQGDRILFGGLETAETIGIYSIAFYLMSSVLDLISKFSDVLFFPALSEIYRKDQSKVLEVYYRIRKSTDTMGIVCAGVLFAAGESIVNFLYSDLYSDAGWMLKILSLSLVFMSPLVSRVLMLAMGMSKFSAIFKIVQTILLIILFPLLHKIAGIEGAIWSMVLVALMSMVFDMAYRFHYGLIKFWSEFIMLPTFVVGWAIGHFIVFVLEKIS